MLFEILKNLRSVYYMVQLRCREGEKMKFKIIFMFLISFLLFSCSALLFSCSANHNYLEVGQFYKANFSDDCYFDVNFKEQNDSTILLEIKRFGNENLGIVYDESFESVTVNGVEKDFITTQSPVGAKQIYIIDFTNDIAAIEVVFNSNDFEKICIENTTAVNWTGEGSYNAIIIHTN